MERIACTVGLIVGAYIANHYAVVHLDAQISALMNQLNTIRSYGTS